jgi:hypothetical protein
VTAWLMSNSSQATPQVSEAGVTDSDQALHPMRNCGCRLRGVNILGRNTAETPVCKEDGGFIPGYSAPALQVGPHHHGDDNHRHGLSPLGHASLAVPEDSNEPPGYHMMMMVPQMTLEEEQLGGEGGCACSVQSCLCHVHVSTS